MTDALWYFGRGSGVVTLVLLTLVVALGIGARSGRPAFGLPRFAVNLLHRNAALLAIVFLGLHMVTLLFDPYAQLRLVDLVLPFAGSYRPFWQGLGTLGFDLAAAIAVTSLLRRRLGVRAWRAVHWLASGFVAGEETAVVAAVDGRPARPTDKLIRTVVSGVDGAPTRVQNVETLAHIAQIAQYGGRWFRRAGTSNIDEGCAAQAISRTRPPGDRRADSRRTPSADASARRP